MTKEQEREIQARVDFKMEQLLTGIKNTANAQWHIAFQHNSQKHQHYHEALKMLEDMVRKEMRMGTPHDYMDEEARREKRDEVTNSIMKRLCKEGDPDYRHKQGLVARWVEDAQKW